MTGRKHRIWITVLVLSVFRICYCPAAVADDYDYPAIFGSNWIKAEQFIRENKVWIRDILNENKLDFHFTMSVVFPELVRYSAIRDRMEITLLKALYVNYGNDYANFSVGVFQMKPSCAEEILKEIPGLMDRKLEKRLKAISPLLTDREKRAMIVREMENPRSQLVYIAALLKLLDKRLRNHQWTNSGNMLAFYATAYNCGFSHSADYIFEQMSGNSFHTGLISSDNKYSYSDIALYYFRNTPAGSE